MKLQRDDYQKILAEKLQNQLGWRADTAGHVAGIAVDALCVTHGGEQIYVPKRIIDKQAILDEYREGKTISQLARRYGLTAETIRKTVKQD